MKTAIELLQLKRIDLRANVEAQTSNAHYYANEAAKSRREVARQQKNVEGYLRQEQESCLKRNDYQRQLNEIDAAIALLESQ